MRKSDKQLGVPFVEYVNTKAAIEALTGVESGAIAVATDHPTAPLGCYNGSLWLWGGGSDYVPASVLEDTQDPTGWLDPSAVTVSYNTATRKITLTGALEYYWQGVKHTLTSPWTSDAHDSADGQYYLYSTDGATFAWSTTAWAFYMLMVAKASLSTSPAYQFAIREVHGLMPWQVHKELHEQISSYRDSGGSLTIGTYAENTATDAANTPGFDAATMYDEDCKTSLDAWIEGTYTTLRIGASNKATFDTAASFPFRSSGSYILVNNPATGAETAAATNQYVNVYQIWIPASTDADSRKYRMVMLQPQRAYTSLASAQAEDSRALLLGDLSRTSPEFVFYARITYVTSAGDTNTGKCRIATGGITYLAGSRQAQVSVSGFAPPNAENVPFTPSGNIAATNAQAALEELDAEKQPLDSDLTAIAALSPSNDDVIQRKAGAWANRTIAQLNADIAPAWATYTPTWSAIFGATPSNGILTGKYLRIGSLVICKIILTWDGTTTGGTGIWTFSLPVTPLDTTNDSEPNTVVATEVGVGVRAGAVMKYSNVVVCLVDGAYVTAIAPFTWGDGDNLTFMYIYEV